METKNNQKIYTKYSHNFKQEMIEKFFNGEGTIKELVDKYNVYSESTFYKWIINEKQKRNITIKRKRKYADDYKEKIINYYFEEAKNIVETAKHFKLSINTVYAWIVKYKANNDTRIYKDIDENVNYLPVLVNKNNKYSQELKMEVVKKYLNGEKVNKLCKQYNITNMKSISEWTRKYLADGEEGLNRKQRVYINPRKKKEIYIPLYKKVSKDKEQEVIDYYNNKSSNYLDTAKRFNIPYGYVYRLINKKPSLLTEKEKSEKRKIYQNRNVFITPNEKQEIIKYFNDNGKDYLKTANMFNLGYNQVYSLVKNYRSK